MSNAIGFDRPQTTASFSPAGASASVAAPINAEALYITASTVMGVRWGVGAQTAVATDIQVGPNSPLLIRVNPGEAYTVAAFGTGNVNVAKAYVS